MLRRIAGFALVIAISLFALYQIRMSLRSEAEQLRYRVASMVQGFNEGRIGPVMEGIHPNFIDASSGADRSRLRDGLRALVMSHRANQRFAMEFVWLEPFEPILDEEAGVARCEVEIQILDLIPDPPRVWWQTPVLLEFVNENGGWQLSKTEKTDRHPSGLPR